LDDELILVKHVYGELISRSVKLDKTVLTVLDARIVCVLEDNRSFYLENVPPEIVYSLKKLSGEDMNDDRERIVDILISIPEVVSILGRYLRRVVIEEYDATTGVYSASAEFEDGGIRIKRKMVPSHAIFLAKLTSKPIYVKKKLVDQQEEFLEEVEMLEDIDDYVEGDYDDDWDEYAES